RPLRPLEDGGSVLPGQRGKESAQKRAMPLATHCCPTLQNKMEEMREGVLPASSYDPVRRSENPRYHCSIWKKNRSGLKREARFTMFQRLLGRPLHRSSATARTPV